MIVISILSSMTHGKKTCSCMFNYKICLSCKCDYDLQLLLVSQRWRWKVSSYHPMGSVVSNNTNENLVVSATDNVVHKWLNNI